MSWDSRSILFCIVPNFGYDRNVVYAGGRLNTSGYADFQVYAGGMHPTHRVSIGANGVAASTELYPSGDTTPVKGVIVTVTPESTMRATASQLQQRLQSGPTAAIWAGGLTGHDCIGRKYDLIRGPGSFKIYVGNPWGAPTEVLAKSTASGFNQTFTIAAWSVAELDFGLALEALTLRVPDANNPVHVSTYSVATHNIECIPTTDI